jgi:hypothetical protein
MVTMTCTKAISRSRRISLSLPRSVPLGAARIAVMISPATSSAAKGVRGRDLLRSRVLGLWHGRHDIGDNVAFARALRKRAEARTHGGTVRADRH